MENDILDRSIEDLELSVRSFNCLNYEGITNLRELITHSEAELLQFRNFGKKSLCEIKELLSKLGLKLGMDITAFPDNRASEYVKSSCYPLLHPKKIILSEEIERKLKEIGVSALKTSARATNILNDLKLRDIYTLLHRDHDRILKCKHCGIKTIKNIQDAVLYLINDLETGKDAKIGKDIKTISLPEWIKYFEEEIIDKEKLKLLIGDKKRIEIFYRRYGDKPETLEQIGNKLSLTRERVRQLLVAISRQMYRSLKYEYKKFIDNFILELRQKFYFIYQGECLAKDPLSLTLFNSILRYKYKRITFDSKLNLWVIGNIDGLMNSLDKFLEKQCVKGRTYTDEEILALANKFCSMRKMRYSEFLEVIPKLIICYCFENKYGSNYYKGISVSFICGQIIKENFPQGFKTSSDVDLFYSYAKEKGFEGLISRVRYKNPHALLSTIFHNEDIVLWDWGVYIHKANININDAILEKVKNWINEKFDKGLKKVSLWGGFSSFQEECINSKIPNEHALYTCMKIKYYDEFSFFKDPYVYPYEFTERINKAETVEKYLLDMQSPVSYDQISADLGLKNYQIDVVVSDKIIRWGEGETRGFIHVDNIRFDRQSLNKIGAYISNRIKKFEHISIKQVFQDNIVLCKQNGILEPRSLYYFLESKIGADFYFPRAPFILSKELKIEGNGHFSHDDLMKDFFLSQNRVIYYQELHDYFVRDRGYKKSVVDNIVYYSEDIVKYTSGSFVSLSTLGWTPEKDVSLLKVAKKRFEERLLLGKPYVNISELLEEDLPRIDENLKINWQATLLTELLGRIDPIQILGTLQELFIVTPNSASIDDEGDLIYFILKSKFGGATGKANLAANLERIRLSANRQENYVELDDRIQEKGEEVFIKS